MVAAVFLFLSAFFHAVALMCIAIMEDVRNKRMSSDVPSTGWGLSTAIFFCAGLAMSVMAAFA